MVNYLAAIIFYFVFIFVFYFRIVRTRMVLLLNNHSPYVRCSSKGKKEKKKKRDLVTENPFILEYKYSRNKEILYIKVLSELIS